MDAVTYPHPTVQAELAARWREVCIDVSERPSVAALFGVAGIPAVVAVAADGVVLGSHVGYLGPSQFVAALRAFSAGR